PPRETAMLPRILEPEVMDTPDEARDYDAMDHGDVNRRFVDDLFAAAGILVHASSEAHPPAGFERLGRPPHVLDVGTGTALIPLELARRGIDCRITAVDLAGEMLELARRNVARAGQAECIALERIDAKSLPYAAGRFD